MANYAASKQISEVSLRIESSKFLETKTILSQLEIDVWDINMEDTPIAGEPVVCIMLTDLEKQKGQDDYELDKQISLELNRAQVTLLISTLKSAIKNHDFQVLKSKKS